MCWEITLFRVLLVQGLLLKNAPQMPALTNKLECLQKCGRKQKKTSSQFINTALVLFLCWFIGPVSPELSRAKEQNRKIYKDCRMLWTQRGAPGEPPFCDWCSFFKHRAHTLSHTHTNTQNWLCPFILQLYFFRPRLFDCDTLVKLVVTDQSKLD